eukprot:CAMPEP_0115483254 /NCGR_PEP_ID=MMETSP0271-20121206/58759_1 /TAXON_ID=71861 /ORGANISM="Scrippsiella trochoidea, Strain CCMP3099" /LENGTH=118 /DNA_ID=CAMNT_0002911095 /DNA_START=117 /DNA_END=470 /DNA_ORIENTATION=+
MQLSPKEGGRAVLSRIVCLAKWLPAAETNGAHSPKRQASTPARATVAWRRRGQGAANHIASRCEEQRAYSARSPTTCATGTATPSVYQWHTLRRPQTMAAASSPALPTTARADPWLVM